MTVVWHPRSITLDRHARYLPLRSVQAKLRDEFARPADTKGPD